MTGVQTCALPIYDGDALASEAGKTLNDKRRTLQKRLEAVTANWRGTERERDAAKVEAADLRKQLDALKTPAETKVEPPAFYTRPKPTEDEIGTKYQTYGEYIEDLTEWKVDEREAKREKDSRAAEDSKSEREAIAKVQERISLFKTEHQDYDAVVNAAVIPDGAPAYRALMQHLRYSELGPQLAYELGKNQAELTRIVNLPPGFAIAALGRLEGQIELRTPAAKVGSASEPPAVTKAHPPIKPVGGSPVTSDDVGDPDDLSPAAVDAYIRRENQKEIARRRR